MLAASEIPGGSAPASCSNQEGLKALFFLAHLILVKA
jgi:hypothetical protein